MIKVHGFDVFRCVPRNATPEEDQANIARFEAYIRNEDEARARLMDEQWAAVHPPERRTDPRGWLKWIMGWMDPG